MRKGKFKLIIVIVFGLLSISSATARAYVEDELPIVVKNIQEWSADYPTVANNWDGMLVQSLEGELPPILSIITSINGMNTKGMKAEAFNNILMNNGKATLEFQKKEKGGFTTGKCVIKYHTSLYWGEGMNLLYPDAFPEDISMKGSKGTQFFNIKTYDFLITSETGLDEAALLDAAGRALRAKGLAKATDNRPDILLTLTTGKDQWNGTSVILNIIDGEKQRQGITQIVWSLEISSLKKDIKESQASIKSSISKYCANYPFDTPAFSNAVTTLGIAFNSQKEMYTGRVVEVLKGTDAYEKGLRGGDIIKSGYEGADLYLIGGARKHWFIAGKKHHRKNWTVAWLMYLPIFPHYYKNDAEHYLIRGGDGSGILNKCHFKIRKAQGGNITVPAPFVEKTFYFTYMR